MRRGHSEKKCRQQEEGSSSSMGATYLGLIPIRVFYNKILVAAMSIMKVRLGRLCINSRGFLFILNCLAIFQQDGSIYVRNHEKPTHQNGYRYPYSPTERHKPSEEEIMTPRRLTRPRASSHREKDRRDARGRDSRKILRKHFSRGIDLETCLGQQNRWPGGPAGVALWNAVD